MARTNQVQDDVFKFYFNIPIITRSLLTLIGLISLGCHVGYIPYDKMHFDWIHISRNFEVWRLVTCFFIRSVSMSSTIKLFLFYELSTVLETKVFLNRPADYLYFVILTCCSSLMLGQAIDSTRFSTSFVYSILYLWSLHYPNTVAFYKFFIPVKGKYLPWAKIIMDMVVFASVPHNALIGMASAHLYSAYCERYITSGPKILSAPSFLKSLFTSVRNGSSRSTGYSTRSGSRSDTGYSSRSRVYTNADYPTRSEFDTNNNYSDLFRLYNNYRCGRNYRFG